MKNKYTDAVTVEHEQRVDDVVFTPTTLELLKKDYEHLTVDREFKVGWLGARSDYVLHHQNIRFPVENDGLEIVGTLGKSGTAL